MLSHKSPVRKHWGSLDGNYPEGTRVLGSSPGYSQMPWEHPAQSHLNISPPHTSIHICYVAVPSISKQFTKSYVYFSSHHQPILREMLSVLFVPFIFYRSLFYFGHQVCFLLGRYVGPSTARPLGMLIMQTERLDWAWPLSQGYGQQKSECLPLIWSLGGLAQRIDINFCQYQFTLRKTRL